MPKLLPAIAAAAVLACASGALAQGCNDYTGEGSGPSRDAALRAAYEAMLRSADPALASAWRARGGRVGDAPGYSVTKLKSQCSAGGSGQVCRISATLCS